MVDFVRFRAAFFAKHGLNEDGNKESKWTEESWDKFSKKVNDAWH